MKLSTWQGFQSSLSATNSHWRKRVGQKQIPSVSATNCFISAGKVPVRQLLSAGKVPVRQYIWKNCISFIGRKIPVCRAYVKSVFCKLLYCKDGKCSSPSILSGNYSSPLSANRADTDPSRQLPSHVFLRIPCRHT